jgi:hypothetical protein
MKKFHGSVVALVETDWGDQWHTGSFVASFNALINAQLAG